MLVLRVTDVFDLDLVVAAGGDHDVVKFLRLSDLAKRSYARFGLPLVESAAREFDILDAQCARNLSGRDVVRTHLVRVDPDTH